MRRSDLRRLLRRLERGLVSGARFEAAMEAEFGRLLSGRRGLTDALGEDRELVWDLLEGLDQEVAAADRHLRTLGREDSLRHLERAGKLLAVLESVTSAAVEARQLKEAFQELVAVLSLGEVSELPTLRVIPRLLDTAAENLRRGRPLSALAVLRSCRRELDRITSRSAVGAGSDLAQRVRELSRRQMYNEVYLAALSRAAEQRYSILVDRLITELEAVHAARTGGGAGDRYHTLGRRLEELTGRARQVRAELIDHLAPATQPT